MLILIMLVWIYAVDSVYMLGWANLLRFDVMFEELHALTDSLFHSQLYVEFLHLLCVSFGVDASCTFSLWLLFNYIR